MRLVFKIVVVLGLVIGTFESLGIHPIALWAIWTHTLTVAITLFCVKLRNMGVRKKTEPLPNKIVFNTDTVSQLIKGSKNGKRKRKGNQFNGSSK
jgi:hypothetical protein